MNDKHYVRQIGTHAQCGRKDCPRIPQHRIILGHWNVQVYVCNPHVTWGLDLDVLTQNTGEALGWEHGYVNGASVTLKDPIVTTTFARVSSHHYDTLLTRTPQLSSTWPTEAGDWS